MGLHEPVTDVHQPEKNHQLANKANKKKIGHVQRTNEKKLSCKEKINVDQEKQVQKERHTHRLSLVDFDSLNFTLKTEDLGNFSSSTT